MRMKSISLATAFALASTAALAQGGAVGGSTQGGPASNQEMNNPAAGSGSTMGSSRPSPKDASTQGAGTAGAAEKKGDAASPGGTMKK